MFGTLEVMPDEEMPARKLTDDDGVEADLAAAFDEIEREEEGGPNGKAAVELPEQIDEGSEEFAAYVESLMADKDHNDLTDDELRLAEITEAMSAATAGRMPEPPEWEYKRPPPPKVDTSHRGLGVGIVLAYAFLGPLFLGYGLGWLADNNFRTGVLWQGWGTVSGAFLGMFALIVVLNRSDQTGPKK